MKRTALDQYIKENEKLYIFISWDTWCFYRTRIFHIFMYFAKKMYISWQNDDKIASSEIDM